jgi:hypothetical protein
MVALSSGVGYFVGAQYQRGPESVSTVTSTLHSYITVFRLGAGNPLRVSISHYPWNFTVFTDKNFRLSAWLTNIGSSNQTFKEFVRPFIDPAVFAANGTELWAWNPPQTVGPMTVMSSQVVSQDVALPASLFKSGQTYTIEVAPISVAPSSNLTVNISYSPN